VTTRSSIPRAPARKPVKPLWQLSVDETEQRVDAEGFLSRYLELLLSQHPTTNDGADHDH